MPPLGKFCLHQSIRATKSSLYFHVTSMSRVISLWVMFPCCVLQSCHIKYSCTAVWNTFSEILKKERVDWKVVSQFQVKVWKFSWVSWIGLLFVLKCYSAMVHLNQIVWYRHVNFIYVEIFVGLNNIFYREMWWSFHELKICWSPFRS